MALSAGTRLGRYEILATIGAGGMGEVYRARDRVLGREVAVKVLTARLSSDPGFRGRFEREARAVAALTHPNILSIHDYGVEGDVCFAVTELLEGRPLRDLLDRRLPWHRAVEIGREIAAGLAVTHARGIVHRDLKPENVFVTSDGRVKILDFGLARHESEVSGGNDIEAVAGDVMTATGVVMGTVGYMSPEQIRGARAGASSDVFSLGCILYEMLSGRPAFRGASPSDTLAATLRDEPPPLSADSPEVPGFVADAVARCLEKDPARRLVSPAELASILSAARSEAIHDSLGREAVTELPSSPPRAASSSAAPAAPVAPRSLAVLPLRNVSSDSEADYLTEGIAESLIDSLSRIPGLRVMARTTVFRLGPDADPRKIAADLAVAAVLTGRLARRESDLDIGVELVDAAGGWRLWGEEFHAAPERLRETERKIVAEVARALDVAPPAGAFSSKTPAASRAAYLLDLKGRYNWNKGTVPSIRKAIEFFRQAIEEDPTDAAAHAGISDCYAALGMDRYGAMPPTESLPRAKAAARAALEIDDGLDEAHVSLGYACFLDLDWKVAERELRRAIEINPERARSHHFYGFFLATQARFRESEEEFRKALELDPLSLLIHADYGWSLYCARQYDRARLQLEKTIELDAAFAQTYLWLALVGIEGGERGSAVAAAEKGLELTAGSSTMLGILALAHARSGDDAAMRSALARLDEVETSGKYVTDVAMVCRDLALGDHDSALIRLERSCEHRASYCVALKVYAFLDPLRGKARFRELLRRSGLEE
jgi:serine/threonine protein kinase/Tfp pilus assembly protein PilF